MKASYLLQLKLTMHFTHGDGRAFCPPSLFTTVDAVRWDHIIVTMGQEQQFLAINKASTVYMVLLYCICTLTHIFSYLMST